MVNVTSVITLGKFRRIDATIQLMHINQEGMIEDRLGPKLRFLLRVIWDYLLIPDEETPIYSDIRETEEYKDIAIGHRQYDGAIYITLFKTAKG